MKNLPAPPVQSFIKPISRYRKKSYITLPLLPPSSVQIQSYRVNSTLLELLSAALLKVWPTKESADVTVEILVVKPDGKTQIFEFTQFPIKIGRAPFCNLQLAAPTVSTVHCEIRSKGTNLYLIDLKSSNGTKLWGNRLHPYTPHLLQGKEQIEISPFKIIIKKITLGSKKAISKFIIEQHNKLSPNHLKTSYAGRQVLIFSTPKVNVIVILPGFWIDWAYTALGIVQPIYEEKARITYFDKVVMHNLALRIADTLEKMGEDPIDVQGPLEISQADIAVQYAYLFLLKTDKLTYLVPVGWNLKEEIKQHSISEPLLNTQFIAKVICGKLILSVKDLESIEESDILIPDIVGIDETHEGRVYIQLGSKVYRGLLRIIGKHGEQGVEVKEDDGSYREMYVGKEVEKISEELEVEIILEIERFKISLKELSSWQNGTIIPLNSKITDPIKIVLIQPGGDKLLGKGKLVKVDDKIGIEIVEWFVK